MNLRNGRHLSFPFRIGSDGRAVQLASLEEHVRDELVQLILTNLGERAFMPEFGGGARRLVFENINDATPGVTKAMLTDAITRWLGHRLKLEELTVDVHEETIEIDVKYQPLGTNESKVLRFQRGGSGQ